MAKPAKHACVVCKTVKECAHSLSLKKTKGVWQTNPVCADCRKSLQGDARAAGKFIAFFSMEASEKEALKRNERTELNRPFLEKFGKTQEGKSFRKTLPAAKSR